jgi:hypothetical protein
VSVEEVETVRCRYIEVFVNRHCDSTIVCTDDFEQVHIYVSKSHYWKSSMAHLLYRSRKASGEDGPDFSTAGPMT